MSHKKDSPQEMTVGRFQASGEFKAPKNSQNLLRAVSSNASQLPSYLGVFAASPALLRSHLKANSELRSGRLELVTRERIALAIADHYGAHSALVSHIQTAQLAGLAMDEIQLARHWHSQDSAHAALLQYLSHFVLNSCAAPAHLYENTCEMGWSEEELVEAFGWVALESMVAMVAVAANLPAEESYLQTELAGMV